MRLALLGFLFLAACNESTVAPPPAPLPSPGGLGPSVSPSGVILAPGDSLLMTADYHGETSFLWSSGSYMVATVSSAGWVKGVAPGPVAITACSKVRAAWCGSAALTVR